MLLPDDETPCFPVREIQIKGMEGTQVPSALWRGLPQALARYRHAETGRYAANPPQGRCLGAQGINILLARAQNHLIARGYITSRVLAPAQDLKTGQLILTVMPGRVAALRTAASAALQADGESLADAAAGSAIPHQEQELPLRVKTAFPLKPGDLLNLRDIEQGLENLKRVPTADADIQIAPSSQTGHAGVGQSELIVRHVQQRPVRLNLSVDDSGTDNTGKYQATATLSVDNPLRLNDLFYASYSRALGGGTPQADGRRGSDDAQYRALMTAGVRFAQAHNLRPGIALTGEQMSQLTSSIVWLEEREAALADGSRHKVLAPQLYLASIAGNISQSLGGSGGLISAGSAIHSDAPEHTVNNRGGAIAAGKAVALHARNIRHESAGRIQSDAVQLKAAEDITINGARVEAGSTLLAQAGGNITVASTTRSNANGTAANGHSSTLRDRLASLSVNATFADAAQPAANPQEKAGQASTDSATDETNPLKGKLILWAGQNINLYGSAISNRAPNGLTHLQAGGNIELGSIWTQSSTRHSWDARNYLHTAQEAELGSRIVGAGDINLIAGQNLHLRAAEVDAQAGHTHLQAGRDITLESGHSSRQIDQGYHRQKSSFWGSSVNTSASSRYGEQALASQVGGQTIDLQAGQDIAVAGSRILGEHNVHLQAGRDLKLAAAQEQHRNQSHQYNKTSGLFSGGGASFTIGQRSLQSDAQSSGTSSAASLVASNQGDVKLQAAAAYQQTGSSVMAAGGDIDVAAGHIRIDEARNSHSSQHEQRFRQSGLSIGVSSPLIEGITGAIQAGQAAQNTDNPRMQALGTALAAWHAAGTPANLAQTLQDPTAGASIGISIGSSKSHSTQHYSERQRLCKYCRRVSLFD